MSKFRKKPVIIDAYKVTDLLDLAEHNWKELPTKIKEIYESGNFVFAEGVIYINTLEGRMRAEKDDWLIIGVKGEPYPCKPDIFEQTYEKVN